MTTSINQLRMNMLDMQTLNSVKTNRPTVDKLIEEQEKEENVFTKKGQDNYNEAMDYNGDGVVTYDEYIQYCEENAVSQYNSSPSLTFVSTTQASDGQSVRPVHIGKVLESYSFFDEKKLNPNVETEV